MSRGLISKPSNAENLHSDSSHQHCCDVTGHYYDCSEECLCFCGLPMTGNDHTDCPVELRPCPEHNSQQGQQMTEEALPEGVVEIKFPNDWQYSSQPRCECGCSGVDAAEAVGRCLHCNHVYAHYTPEIENRHFACHCPGVPETVKKDARARLAKRRI